MSPASPYRILLVDDDEHFLTSTARVFHQRWPIVTAPNGAAGLAALEREGPFAVVISDFSMPGLDGIRFLAEVRARAPETVRVMLTGVGDLSVAIEAVNEGHIFRFLTKPCATATLARAIEDSLQQYRLIETEREARQQEIRIAAEIQAALLLEPPPAHLRGASVAALTIPSAGADGDFIDFFDHAPTCLDVVVGDVMGKGIPAALIGAGTKTRFSRILTRLLTGPGRPAAGLPSPEAIMRQLQDELGDRLFDLHRFVTLCYARFDLAARRLTFVDAGHMPIVWVAGADGTCRELKGTGCPLGFPFLSPYQEASLEFAPGDLFLLFSDGLLEGSNAQRESFGLPRLTDLLGRHRHEAPAAILEALLRAFKAFVGREEGFHDDLSMVVVKIDAATG